MSDIDYGPTDEMSIATASAELEAILPDDEEDGSDEEILNELRPADHDEGGADEGEEDEEDDDGEDDGKDDAELHKVKVDGEEVEVTYDELVKGYQRTASYTQKTQALAAARREIDAERSALSTASEAYAQRLEVLSTFAAQHATPEQFAALEREYVAVRQAQAEHFTAEYTAHLEAERSRLLEAVPEWKDKETARADSRSLAQYAESLGFTSDDVAAVADHRLILLLRKAAKYDELTTTGRARLDAKRADAPRVLKPGNRENNSRRNPNAAAIKEAQARFKRTGSQRDGARVLELTMPDDF